MSVPAENREPDSLDQLLGHGRLHKMLTLAARIGQSSGMIDPFSGLDRRELREWHDRVLAALQREVSDAE
jgi:hypothetical protein